MEVFYSIQELVELQINMQNPNYPNNRQGFEYRAKKEKWTFTEEKSIGRNGFTRKFLIPNDLLSSIQKYSKSKDPLQLTITSPNISPFEDRKHQAANELMDWQVETAENRLFVVRYVQQKVKGGEKKTKVIETMIAEADSGTLLPEILEAILKANAKAGDKRTVSRRSVFDWIKAVDDAEQHKINVLSVLAPKARAVADIPAWATALLKLWGQPQKPTLAACMELLPSYLDSNIATPSYAQAYRFLNEKMGNVDVQKGRMGNREIKNIKGFVRRNTESLLPADIYTADGHCFDAEVAHPIHGKPFRPEITAILDVASRRIVGWSIDLSENKWAVLDAIRMAATECGIPAMFYVDNGSGYKNAVLTGNGKGILNRLNVTVSHALPYNSQAKGLIERSHRTLWVKAAKQLPTYIGKDMDAEASNKVHKLTRSDVIKFGQSTALMNFADFVIFARKVVADYNNKPHSSLKRMTDPDTMKSRCMTPLEMWNSTLDMEFDCVDNWDNENFFRPVVERKVLRCEINLFNNRYFHKDLEQYHDEYVQVGYDIHSAEKITVRDMDGRLICIAIWNANKRDYFPKPVIEQAREQRAQGRLRRLAVKQAEVVEELNPQQVIEHIENQNLIPFNSNKHQQLMNELNALPVRENKEVIYFTETSVASQATEPSTQNLTPVQRWMNLDQRIQDGEELTQENKDFWEMFQLSKKFKQLEEDNAELNAYLAQRQG